MSIHLCMLRVYSSCELVYRRIRSELLDMQKANAMASIYFLVNGHPMTTKITAGCDVWWRSASFKWQTGWISNKDWIFWTQNIVWINKQKNQFTVKRSCVLHKSHIKLLPIKFINILKANSTFCWFWFMLRTLSLRIKTEEQGWMIIALIVNWQSYHRLGWFRQ